MNENRHLGPEIAEWRRFRALELHERGWLEVDIAEALDVNKGTVSRWLAAADAGGPEALVGHSTAGSPPKLTPAQLRKIPEFLGYGAEAYGFRGEVWTCARIAQVIQMEFGVSYHKDHVSRLMKGLGWTPQIPDTPAIQRDEVAIEHWRVEVWPELLRKAARAPNPGICRRIWLLLVAGSGQDVWTERQDADHRQEAYPRSSVGDGRCNPGREVVYAGSPGIAVERA